MAATIGLTVIVTTRQSRQGARAHSALCALRGHYVREISRSQEFLRAHPRGIPGIPPAVIRTGVKDEQFTVDSLAGLHC